jgi:hypothetical protein
LLVSVAIRCREAAVETHVSVGYASNPIFFKFITSKLGQNIFFRYQILIY